MEEVNVTGQNPIAFPEVTTWHWEVAIYLFLGGLVAGLMVVSAVMRMSKRENFSRAIFVADIAGLPLLGIGMFFLWLDLANKLNVWRFFTTLQWTSPMSWGSWILLLAMVVLLLRFLGALPVPHQAPDVEGKRRFTRRAGDAVRSLWARLAGIGRRTAEWKWLSGVSLVLGLGLGFYTGLLLSTIPARPLWNTGVLAPLFLVSGLASAGAFMCLFITKEEHKRLVPATVLMCGLELALILGYALSMVFGMGAAQQAAGVLFAGGLGLAFWLLVVLVGLLLPAGVESFELLGKHIPEAVGKVLPVFKLTGGVALRILIVYAGLQTFV